MQNVPWKLSGFLLVTALLFGAPAKAVETISWDDLGKMQNSCGWECTRYAWVEVEDCYYDPELGRTVCDYYLDQVCVETSYICREYRVYLSDGDWISYACNPGTRPDGYEFTLQKPSSMTWWKGVKGYRNQYGSSYAGEISLQDGATESGMISFTPSDSNAHIILAKAKFLGIHTDMYKLVMSPKIPVGKRCTLYWWED
ncbi:MAG: hypothetical protein L0Y64_16295 [Myxococcaceae bacterium]|nr:hypothetical protein [Myxococcaceae bacterium]